MMPYAPNMVMQIMPARPSIPSVKFTAFAIATIINAAIGRYHQPRCKGTAEVGQKRFGTINHSLRLYAIASATSACKLNLARALMPKTTAGAADPFPIIHRANNREQPEGCQRDKY